MCAYRVAFRNCYLQCLNQLVKKQSMAFTERLKPVLFAMAMQFAACAFTTGYHRPADVQQLVELQ